MRKRHHPPDEVLVELLDAPAERGDEERAEIEAHVSSCTHCTARVDALKSFIRLLRDASVWDRRASGNGKAARQWSRAAAEIAEQMREEKTEAEKLARETITGPSQWWKTRALQADGSRTYGFVQTLLERADALINTTPPDALTITALAVEIAESLRVDAYPFDLVLSARAQAWRDHAYVLFYVGRFPESLDAIDRAEQLFAQLPVAQFDLARTSLIRANIYRSTERIGEALSLTRNAAELFESFGDRQRYVKARMTEAAMLFHAGSIADALAVWITLEHEPSLQDDVAFGMLLHNIGTCYTHLGQPEHSIDYLSRAMAHYELHGAVAEIARTRWSLGSALAAQGRLRDAVPALRETWRHFGALEMSGDAALAGLELAEVLLTLGDAAEVPAICRQILDQFTRNGMTSRAITALSFLREAVALDKASPSLVRHVREFLRELPANPARAFAPPPLQIP